MNTEYKFANTLIQIHSSDMSIEEKKNELKKQFGFSDIQCKKCQDIFKYKLPLVHYVHYQTHKGSVSNEFDYVYHCEYLYDINNSTENTARLKEISRLIYMMIAWYMYAKRPYAVADTLIDEMHTGERTNGKYTSAMKTHSIEIMAKYISNPKYISGSYQSTFDNLCTECLVTNMKFLQLDNKREEPGTDAHNICGILLFT